MSSSECESSSSECESSSSECESLQTSEEYFEEHLKSSLSNVFKGQIPEIVTYNNEWLWEIGSGFLCCLCDKTIQISSYYWTNVNNFEQHLKSEGHTNNLEYASDARDPPSDTYDKFEEHIRDKLIELYGSDEEIPSYVEESMEYIGIYNDYFHCDLCNKYLQNSYLDSQIMEQMESHLTSRGHENLLYESIHSCKTSAELYCLLIKDSLTSLFRSKLPQFVKNCIDYIDKDDDNDKDYYCRLCDKHMQVSQNDDITVSNFESHLLSSGHEYYLNKYVLQIPKTAFEKHTERITELLNINFNNNIPYDVNRCINYFVSTSPDSFYCCLCEEDMEIYKTKYDIMRIINLKPHLNSRQHKQLLNSI